MEGRSRFASVLLSYRVYYEPIIPRIHGAIFDSGAGSINSFQDFTNSGIDVQDYDIDCAALLPGDASGGGVQPPSGPFSRKFFGSSWFKSGGGSTTSLDCTVPAGFGLADILPPDQTNGELPGFPGVMQSFINTVGGTVTP